MTDNVMELIANLQERIVVLEDEMSIFKEVYNPDGAYLDGASEYNKSVVKESDNEERTAKERKKNLYY